MKSPISDETWNAVRPLLPGLTSGRSSKTGGRPSVDDRTVLNGILYVLRERIAWMMLPAEFGLASGITCWRRLRQWQAAGVWPQVQEILQARIDNPQDIDWSRAALQPTNTAQQAPPIGKRSVCEAC